MKVAIIGAGGLGGFLVAKFANSKIDATLIAREPSLSAIRSNGIVLNSPAGRVSAKNVRVTDNPAEVGAVDFVIFAVKLWDTEAAARSVLPVIGPNTALISFQNGVHKDELIGKVLGRERVLGGFAEISVRREGPGIIQLTSEKHRFVVGSYPGRDFDSARMFADVMRGGGINCVVSNKIESELWEEYALVVGVSAMTAACQQTIGPIRQDPAARELLLDIMEEVAAVGRAHGVTLSSTLAQDNMKVIDSLAADLRASMAVDLANENRLELPWLSGGVAALGKDLSIPTPANRAISGILSLYAQGKRPAS
jgi:2-dehydropantoate 2-reductase